MCERIQNEGIYKQVIAELEQKVRTGQEELEALKTEVDSQISEYRLYMCVYVVLMFIYSANKTFQQMSMQKDGLEKALQQKVLNVHCIKLIRYDVDAYRSKRRQN